MLLKKAISFFYRKTNQSIILYFCLELCIVSIHQIDEWYRGREEATLLFWIGTITQKVWRRFESMSRNQFENETDNFPVMLFLFEKNITRK